MSNFDDDYEDEFDEDVEEQEQDNNYKNISKKKDEITKRLPPKKDGIGKKLFEKFLKGKGVGGFAGLKLKLTIAAVVAIVVAIIFLVIIAAFLLARGSDTAKAAVKTRKAGVESLGINEQSSEQDKKALAQYNSTDSLLGFSTDQLSKIYQGMLDDNSTLTRYLKESGNKKVGEHNFTAALLAGDYNTAFSVNAKRTLYEHILRTEKYNFNAINWKQQGHNSEARDMSTSVLVDRELVVPSGTDEEQLAMLMDLTSPFLLTNNIPFGMLSGLVMNSTSNSANEEAGFSEKFVYEVLKESLTKMTVYKYTVSSVKVNTAYEEYTKVKFNQNLTVKLDDGKLKIVSASNPVPEGEGEQVKTNEERYQNDTTNTEDYWYVTHAKTFDNEITNEFEFESYSEDDYNNLKNPDSNTLVATEAIDRVQGKRYVAGEEYLNFESYFNTHLDDWVTLLSGGTVQMTVSYTQESGQKKYYEKEWKDKLQSKKSEVRALTYSDVINYNTVNDTEFSKYETDKTLVDKDDIENDEDIKIYEKYQEEDKQNGLYGLTMIDILNSNPGVYNKYLASSKSRYSKYTGVSRIRVKEGYRQIKTMLDVLADKNAEGEEKDSKASDAKKKVPFVYGSSLGYEVVTINYGGSSGSYLTGMALLKAYLRSREGHEGLADENGNPLPSTAIDQAKFYKVGLVWNGSKYTRTVGYGVDLDYSGYEPVIMEAMGRTTQFEAGELIPVEIVDKCEEDEISKAIDAVHAEFGEHDLKEYQVHALVSRYYNCGCAGWKAGREAGNNLPIVQNYEQYWKEEEDDQYEALYEQYKDNPENSSEIISHVDYSHGLYTNIMQWPTNDGILVTRRQSEWILFTLGYYDSLQKFYTNSITPGGIDLYNSDGSVNLEKCAELTNWFVDNFFTGSATMRFGPNEMGGWTKQNLSSSNTSCLNTAEFPFLSNGLETYQCTWWARIRATYQAQMLDPEHLNGYIKTSGNGCQVARNTADHYGIPLNEKVETIKPNSIISFNEFTAEFPDCGHVAFIEAVDYDRRVFYVSHCGGGHSWFGITEKTFDQYSGGNAHYFGGSVAVEDIVNSEVYQGGNR